MTERARMVALLLTAILASGCAGTVRSQVLDAETRRPITDAIVLGVWTRCAGLFICQHEFVGTRETATDEAGWFTLERLRSSGLYGEAGGQAITVYKPGYAPWSNLFVFPTSELRKDRGIPRPILLERFPAQQSYDDLRYFISNSTRSRVGLYASPRLWDAMEQVRKRPQLRYKAE